MGRVTLELEALFTTNKVWNVRQIYDDGKDK